MSGRDKYRATRRRLRRPHVYVSDVSMVLFAAVATCLIAAYSTHHKAWLFGPACLIALYLYVVRNWATRGTFAYAAALYLGSAGVTYLTLGGREAVYTIGPWSWRDNMGEGAALVYLAAALFMICRAQCSTVERQRWRRVRAPGGAPPSGDA